MTYEVKFTDPAKLPIVIPSRSVNSTSTDVALFGYTNLEYGEPLNEAFLHLLENFGAPAVNAGLGLKTPSTDPILNKFLKHPTEGQYWFNKTRNSLFVYHSAQWHEIAMGSQIAVNWGLIFNGQNIPRPVNRFGYVFPYSECSWSVAPRKFLKEPDWLTCLTDLNGVVTSRMRPKGETGLVDMPANYLIIGIRGNVNAGTVRAVPCPPLSAALNRRSPSGTTTTVETQVSIPFDLEALAGVGAQGPISYAWTIPPTTSGWTVSINKPSGGSTATALASPRITGAIAKTDKTTTTAQTATFSVLVTDGCGQTTTVTYTLTANFTLRALPTVSITNCARTPTVSIVSGAAPQTVTNSLSVSRPSGARWKIDWNTAGITTTGGCAGIVRTVTSDTETELDLSWSVDSSPSSTCVTTIPYTVVDLDTGATSAVQTCTTTITRTTGAATTTTTATPGSPIVNIAYPCTSGKQLGNAGAGASSITSGAPIVSGGTGPYAYSLDSSATGACAGAGVTVSAITVNPSTGVVSYTATPPASGSGDCVLSYVVRVIDSDTNYGTATVTKRLRWTAAASPVVTTMTRTCPSTITIQSTGSTTASRTATITIPVVVSDQFSAVLSSGYILDWVITTACGSITFSGLSGSVTATGSPTNVTFTAVVPLNASFSCTSTLTITARNADTTWSVCRDSVSCPITIVADSTVVTPLNVTYTTSGSDLTPSCVVCSGVNCGPTAVIKGNIVGGDPPYSVSGTGFTLTGTTCAASQYVTNVAVSGSTVTATVKMPDGATDQTCDGTLAIAIKDSSATVDSFTENFSLVRTVCIPACITPLNVSPPGQSPQSNYCLGFLCANTAGGALVYFTNDNGNYTATGGRCGAMGSSSLAVILTIDKNPYREGAQRYDATPCAQLYLDIVVPGVGDTRIFALAHARGNITTDYPAVIDGRTFTAHVTLNATLTGSTSTTETWNMSTSYTVTPATPACASSSPTTTTTGGGGGGGGGGCVTRNSLIFGSGVADTVRVGDLMTVINSFTHELSTGTVQRADINFQPCVRLTTSSGIVLECSTTAPIAVADGSQVKAPELLGRLIPVYDHGVFKTEEVVSVEDIGEMEVVWIACEDNFFLAGAEEGRYLLHHNTILVK